MDSALAPVFVDVFAHHLYSIGNERWLRRLMQTAVNLHWCISKRPSEPMQSVESDLMQL